MRKQLKFLLVAVSSLVLVAFGLFVFNQVMQVYLYTSTINALLGKAVLWSLVLLFAVLFIVPVVLYFRLPTPLPPPESEEGRAVYLEKLRKRLVRNKFLRSEGLVAFSEETAIQQALAVLDARADVLIKNTAKSVFLTTAISQNGKLDALTVLITQTKMVWDIAHIYYQRPAPRDMLTLYANVGAATFLATQIEDLDISEQLEPVVGSLMQNSALKSVPFVGSISSVVVDSLMEGTINAFLTLRVGIVTKRYCGTLDVFNARTARRAAFKEATGMLRTLVLQTSGQVVSAIVQATKKAGIDTVKSGVDATGRAAMGVKNTLGGWLGIMKKSSE